MKNMKIFYIFIIFFILTAAFSFAAQPKQELKEIKKQIEIHKKKLKETEKIEHNVIEELKKVSKELNEIDLKIRNHRAKIKKFTDKNCRDREGN